MGANVFWLCTLCYCVAGLFFTEGKLWHEQRRYALRNLRDFGFGRRHDGFEIEKHEEVLSLVELLKYGPKYDFEKVRWTNMRKTTRNYCRLKQNKKKIRWSFMVICGYRVCCVIFIYFIFVCRCCCCCRNSTMEKVQWSRTFLRQRSVTFYWKSYWTNACQEKNSTFYKSECLTQWLISIAFTFYSMQFYWFC